MATAAVNTTLTATTYVPLKRGESRSGRPQGPTALRHLPRPAQVFVFAVIGIAAVVLVVSGPHRVPNIPMFLALLVASALASGLKLRLPLGSSASNLSISYTVDFAALLLLGTDLTMIVTGVSACTQSTFATRRHNPLYRVVFNIAALILTVYVSGSTFTLVGGAPGALDLQTISRPLVAAALAYYLMNTAIVATVIALTTGQRVWSVWNTNFLWTAPSYFVGAGAAALGAALWQLHQGWLLPLAAAPVYLTFRSYRIYVDRIQAEKRHNEEVLRLHRDTVAALEAARQSEQRYALAAAGSNDGLWDWDIPANALYCSERWKLMIGLPADSPVASLEHWVEYVHADDRKALRAALDAHLAGETSHFEHEYRVHHVSGEIRWVLCRGIAVRDDEARPVRMAGSQTDITESRRVQDTLAQAARHDPLTGLPNRTLFSELLQRAILQGSRSPSSSYAVLFIDLDGFKLVNDSLGHLIGDQFLIAIAQRLQTHLRPGDSLARLGGDEFAVLIRGFLAPHEVCMLTERLQHALSEPLNLEGREIYASASIGIVLGNAEYKSVADLLRDADTAMYRAKAAGRGGYELFDPAMHASAMKRLTLETELRRAVERKEFVVFYQPIVELVSSEICGFEALVRWMRPDGRIGEPSEFIGVAEDTGLIVPLTYFVMREACQQVAAWQSMFARPWSISVNISSKLFTRSDFIAEVQSAMSQSGLFRGSLKLEITESVLLKHSDVVERNFELLKKIPVAVHLDDFGTGYSSLSYLQRYPVDALKLDRSFVARMGTEGDECPIGNAIVKLARELGMGLIAEGVETSAHAEQLLALDCPHAQGYLFSEPLPAHAVVPLLSRHFGAITAAVA